MNAYVLLLKLGAFLFVSVARCSVPRPWASNKNKSSSLQDARARSSSDLRVGEGKRMECMCHTLPSTGICAAWSCTDRKAWHRRAACETERTDGRCSSGRRSTVSELRLQRHAGQSAERNPAAMQTDGLQLVE